MNGSPIIGSAGELLVEFVAADRNSRHRRPTSYRGPFPSGAPAIFIDQTARCGATALFAGAVGDDAFGEVILDRFREDGVSTDIVARLSGVPTGSAFVSYNDDGSRDFVFNIAHSAAAHLGEAEDIAAAMRKAGIEVFHVSGSSLGDPGMAKTLLGLAQTLHRNGVAISFDPNIRKELVGEASYRHAVHALLAISTYVLPSEEDAAVLFHGASLESFAASQFASGAKYVVLKRGADGVSGLEAGGERIDLPPFPVEVVDPTGAGDCFCATLVTLVAGGMAFAEALSHANVAGALAVGRLGPMEGNSGLDEIEGLLNGGGR
jgi:sugar/nucleoside kinase (ribokinase family)